MARCLEFCVCLLLVKGTPIVCLEWVSSQICVGEKGFGWDQLCLFLVLDCEDNASRQERTCCIALLCCLLDDDDDELTLFRLTSRQGSKDVGRIS